MLKSKISNWLNSISIKTKIASILIFFLCLFIVTFLSVSNLLTSMNTKVEELSSLYKLKSQIFELNKDISETQRLVLAYGRTGSQAIYRKLNSKSEEALSGLSEIESSFQILQINEIINSLIAVSKRYKENINSLKELRERKEKAFTIDLYQAHLELEKELKKISLSGIQKERFLQAIFKLSFYSQNYITSKNFKSKREFSKVQKILKNQVKKLDSKGKSFLDSLEIYKETFDQTVIANRNYTTLVNVVMSGEASEFSNLTQRLTDEVKNLTEAKRKVIKEDINNNNKSILLAFLTLLPFIFAAIYYSNKNITNALIRISKTFDQFLNNNFNEKVPERNRKDEIGRLANAAEEFKKLNKKLQEEKERAQMLTKTKSDFLANMSHEIRTPMNGIMGMVEHLKDTEVSKDQREMLETIDSCGDSLSTILNDILDLSKIESRMMQLEERPIFLEKLIQEVDFLFKEAALKKRITLTSKINSKQTENFFMGDITRIKQILINLVSNAIKFTKEGGVNLMVTVDQIENNYLSLKFSIKDTGIGIAKIKQELIFKEFSQSDTSITREFGGTGLGLSISKKLAELMKSELFLESEINQGSHFYFELHCEQVSPENAIHEYSITRKNLSFPSGHCLIVEDNEINIKVLKRRLDKYQISYDIALNGEDALEKIKENKYHLIFMDLQMPIMDGLTAARELRNRGCKTPIVAMTANVQESDKRNCEEAGMDYFLGKPVKREELEETLTEIFLANAS